MSNCPASSLYKFGLKLISFQPFKKMMSIKTLPETGEFLYRKNYENYPSVSSVAAGASGLSVVSDFLARPRRVFLAPSLASVLLLP